MHETTALIESNGARSNSDQVTKKGLSVIVAATFILGATVGGGILVIPKSFVNAGWSAIVEVVIIGTVASCTGMVLGKCWMILRLRYPEYKEAIVSDPYSEIGYRAAGTMGRLAARVCVDGTAFGTGYTKVPEVLFLCALGLGRIGYWVIWAMPGGLVPLAVVYLLLISENIYTLLINIGHVQMPVCTLVLIVFAFLAPLTWLGTPKDFWQAGVIAAVTSILCGILIVVGLAQTIPETAPSHSKPTFSSYTSAFGSIVFAFGGAFVYPNVQVDMKDSEKFPLSVVIGIISSIVIYAGVGLGGFLILGDNLTQSNIFNHMKPGWILYIAIILITAHLFMAFLIVINPVNQDLDKLFSLEDKCSVKRCLVRSGMLLIVLFVALSIPHFGLILSLVGGTLINLTSFVLPPLFYVLIGGQKKATDAYGPLPRSFQLKMSSITPTNKKQTVDRNGQTSCVGEDGEMWTQIIIPIYVKGFLYLVMFVGICGGIACTYSIIATLVNGSQGFTVPCYVNWTVANPRTF